MKAYYNQYKTELLNNVMPFWLNNSKDEEHGGYYTCLTRSGKVYDTDKFLWLQCRELWMFSALYNQIEQKLEWSDMALHGANFLVKHGRDSMGDWYFSLNKKGKPLVQPYNIFSDCFAAMGFAEFYKINTKEEYAKIALSTFNNILKRRNNPKGKYSKTVTETRNLKNFGLPMILCNLSLEMEHLLEKNIVDELIEEVINEVMEVFYQKDTGLIMENVNQDGSTNNSFEGRLINPGHIMEAMWFIIELGERKNDKALIDKAVEIAFTSLEYGWDKKHDGIFYFLDVEGHPPQQLEWDQKLWWVHLEALVCMAKIYQLTGIKKANDWFEKLHHYTWKHFKDAEYPEWFGYLNRRGEILLPLKGGKWKGCFHVPRGLLKVVQTLEKIPSATLEKDKKISH